MNTSRCVFSKPRKHAITPGGWLSLYSRSGFYDLVLHLESRVPHSVPSTPLIPSFVNCYYVKQYESSTQLCYRFHPYCIDLKHCVATLNLFISLSIPLQVRHFFSTYTSKSRCAGLTVFSLLALLLLLCFVLCFGVREMSVT